MNRAKNYFWVLLVLPGVLFVTLFMLIPLFSLCLTSIFPDQSFSLSSFFSLFKDLYFQQTFVRSIRLSLLSTFMCALLGFPTAYYISKYSKHKGMMMAFARCRRLRSGVRFFAVLQSLVGLLGSTLTVVAAFSGAALYPALYAMEVVALSAAVSALLGLAFSRN